jgi:hypothetical protein
MQIGQSAFNRYSRDRSKRAHEESANEREHERGTDHENCCSYPHPDGTAPEAYPTAKDASQPVCEETHENGGPGKSTGKQASLRVGEV